MSSDAWILEPNAEREILLPWLDSETDPYVKAAVVEYIAGLLDRPFRPLLEDDDTGVFSVRSVPHTNVGLTWTLDIDGKQVVLAHVG